MENLQQQIDEALVMLMTVDANKAERAKLLVEFSKKVKKKHKTRF